MLAGCVPSSLLPAAAPRSAPGPARSHRLYRHDLAILGQRVAQAVDLGGAQIHQLLAHTVQRQDCLLLVVMLGVRIDSVPDQLGQGEDGFRVCVIRSRWSS